MTTYRFQEAPVNLAEVDANLPAGITAAIVGTNPVQTADLTLSDDAGADDLKTYMASIGWTFVLSF